MPKLSRRENEVARLVAGRLTNREIAERLFISERTAEYHVEQIRNKLGVHSREEIGALLAEGPRPDAPPNRLPRQLTRFVGRSSDLAAVPELLGRARLVTITGAGGTGKTRVALEVAQRVVDRYPDGAWFVDLQALEDGRLVADETAAALEVTDLERELAAGVRLIVLDNCEQVADGCREMLARLLVACPGLAVLATSREPLHVAGEAVWTLRPMELDDAAELFLDRAALAAPDVTFAAAERSVIAAICGDLDGIPLAIELAASRARVMSLADMEQRLKRRVGALGDAGAQPLRHRSLAATVEWSYELLSAEERELFKSLGVFAGPFLLDSAEAVTGEDVAPVLDRLVERSMVTAEVAPSRPTRYRLLVTMREYARERLADEGTTETLRAAHFRRYRDLAGMAATGLESAEQGAWMRRIEDELDEYRAAVEWALANDPDGAVAIAGGLTWFWGLRGRVTEGLRLLRSSLAAGQAPGLDRGRALIGAGWLSRLQGDFTAGAAFHRESVEVLSELDEPIELGKALVWNAEAASSQGDWEQARRGWEDAIALLEPLGQASVPLAYAHIELAMVHALDRQAEAAESHASEGRALMEALGNRRGIGVAHVASAHACLLRGDSAGAARQVLEAAESLIAAGAPSDLIWPLGLGAVLLIERGDLIHGVELAGCEAARREAGERVAQMDTPSWRLGPALDRARAELGERSFAEAWARGRAMEPEAALRLLSEDPARTEGRLG